MKKTDEVTDTIDRVYIQEGLRNAGLSVRVVYKEETGSTNEDADILSSDCDVPVLVIANKQNKGRGRRGRDFFSPAGSGLYMSLALFGAAGLMKTVKVTAVAAVAVAQAIDKVVFDGTETSLIKWVNDIYVDERKVCGILSEALLPGGGRDGRIVIGMGINVYEPDTGFPQEIVNKAGYLVGVGQKVRAGLRNELAAEIIRQLFYYMGSPKESLDIYRNKSCLTGCYVKINSFSPDDKMPCRAKVIGIDDDCGLLVEYEDGQKKTLTSGEVSVVRD